MSKVKSKATKFNIIASNKCIFYGLFNTAAHYVQHDGTKFY